MMKKEHKEILESHLNKLEVDLIGVVGKDENLKEQVSIMKRALVNLIAIILEEEKSK